MEVANSQIKKLREKLNLSQEEFGKSIGLSKSGISNIESGTRTVRENYIELICTKYNVSKEWLTTGSNIAEESHLFETFISYLKSLGYSFNSEIDEVLESHKEDIMNGDVVVKKDEIIIDKAKYLFCLSKKGVTAVFTEEEFQELQNTNKHLLDGVILLQGQKTSERRV